MLISNDVNTSTIQDGHTMVVAVNIVALVRLSMTLSWKLAP